MAVTKLSSLAKVSSVSLVGLEARRVEVEVALAGGLEEFHIVGLAGAAVREARKRVTTAIISSGEAFPRRKITVNLAPGDLRKDGSVLDLPLAIGILTAADRLDRHRVGRFLFLGELALDGRLRPVRGALAAALAAREMALDGLVLPRENAPEAALVSGLEIAGATNLLEAIAFLQGEACIPAPPVPWQGLLEESNRDGPDLAEVRGQGLARRALEIAAAGGHNLLLVGPPGAGKTMLARCLPGILPPLTSEEALEITHIWSVAGLLVPGSPVVGSRPFRSPHHHASPAAIIGGGSPVPRPGEISLAHRGVLFMDELPHFSRGVLDALRQPLEEGVVTVARQGLAVTFPASFCLVAAANPCLCGKGSPEAGCTCTSGRLDSYRSRLSGPLIDRIDLHVEVPRLSEDELLGMVPSEPSEQVRGRVAAARRRREVSGTGEANLEELDAGTLRFLKQALAEEQSSARALQRVLRVVRTIADLEGCEEVLEPHVAEALQFRRSIWER